MIKYYYNQRTNCEQGTTNSGNLVHFSSICIDRSFVCNFSANHFKCTDPHLLSYGFWINQRGMDPYIYFFNQAMFGLLPELAIMPFLQHCYRLAVANSVWLHISVLWYTRGRINNACSFTLLVLYDIASKPYFSLLAAIPKQSDHFHVNFMLVDKGFFYTICNVAFFLVSINIQHCSKI